MASVAYRPEVHQDLDALPRNLQARVKRAIERRLLVAPERYGERLRRSLLGLWKMRVGDLRIIYELAGERVTVWAVCHRGTVYPEAERRWKRR